jgi:acetyltransferase-like isoleucine patch superfamily enzyme
MREAAKTIARVLSLIAVAPLLGYYGIVRMMAPTDRVLESCSQLLALVPGLPGQYLRRAFYAHTLEYCGKTAVISFGVILSSAGARIADGAYIGPFCTIGLAHIDKDTLIAAGTQIPSGPHTHGLEGGLIREEPGRRRVVKIGPDAWVGNNAVVMADVGAGSIVGAGAVVTRPIPPRTVAAGVPAQAIRHRDAPSAVAQ